MKATAAAAILLAAVVGSAHGADEGVSPLGKVIELISSLQTKTIKEGETSQKLYTEFAEWCEDRSKELSFEIKTGKATAADLSAVIDEETANMGALDTKIGELSGAISSNEAQLKDATALRKKEQKDFSAEEEELVGIIEMLERGAAVLEREMAKGGASMLQAKNVGSLAQAFDVMVKASLIDATDADKLASFVQSSHKATDAEEEAEEDEEALTGAPAASAHESKSGTIIETLQDLTDKANAQLDDLRNKETAALHNFEMLKQSVMDEIKYGNKDMAEAKKGLAASAERKSAAEGDLTVTSKDLKTATEAKAELHHECMSKAEEFEVETTARSQELKALAEAKKALKGIIEGSSSAASFVQVASKVSSKAAAKASEKFKVVRFVRDLAKKTRAPALTQLARRMMTALRSKTHSPFGKVKAMITDMLAKLEDEAEEEAGKKAWCDKELSETGDAKSDKEDEVEKISTKMEQMSAESAKLKEEVAVLQNELSLLSSSQAEMDKIRAEEKEAYEKNRADAQKAVDGVKKAVSVLKDYYSKSGEETGGGAIDSVLGLLEVIESDYSKELAEIISAEETAVSTYEAETKENDIEKTTKTADVKHKTKESASLDKAGEESKGDLGNLKTQLDSVNEYYSRLQAECSAKPESYEERKKRRAAELAGLKEALAILESQTAFIQEQGSQYSLRGVKAHQQDA